MLQGHTFIYTWSDIRRRHSFFVFYNWSVLSLSHLTSHLIREQRKKALTAEYEKFKPTQYLNTFFGN